MDCATLRPPVLQTSSHPFLSYSPYRFSFSGSTLALLPNLPHSPLEPWFCGQQSESLNLPVAWTPGVAIWQIGDRKKQVGDEVESLDWDRDLKVQRAVQWDPSVAEGLGGIACCTPTGHLCVCFPLAWGRFLEVIIPKHRTDSSALPKRRSSPTARPPCVRSYRKRESGQVSAWTSLLSFHWDSRTSGRKQTPTLLMLSKKTGKRELWELK